MRQIIPFVKDIIFKDNIYEITSIALEHNLNMENDDSVVGDFIISGKYKINDININEEKFEYKLPFDITLDDKYNMKKASIDIDDFYYELIDKNDLRVHIDVLVDNLVYIEKEDINEDIISNEIIDTSEKDMRGDEVMVNEEVEILEEKECDENNNINNITNGFLNQNEEYVTYKVHIIRDNETIDDLVNKYNTSKEEIEKYNTIDNITMGSKIVIPINNE